MAIGSVLAVVAMMPAAVIIPAPPADFDFAQLLVRDRSATIVSLDVPWDGGGIELGAVAEEPVVIEPEPAPKSEPAPIVSAAEAGASRSLPVETVGSAPPPPSAIEQLQWAAAQGAPIQQQTNGAVPDELLCSIPWSPSFQVYCPAVYPLNALNAEYKQAFGTNISFASAYRSGFQGRSFHGWGMAIDLNGPSGLLKFGDPQFAWLMENAPNYGWFLPFWAGSGGSNPEPWHWEFGSYYHSSSTSDFASKAPPVLIRWIKH